MTVPDPDDVWSGDDAVIVHDYIGAVGGSEVVLRELARLFPRAPILMLFADRTALARLGAFGYRRCRCRIIE